MFVVVSYDIVDDKRRARICKTLKNFGRRVQYSVFECNLDSDALGRLAERLSRLIANKEDSIRFYFLCESCLPKAKVMGLGKVTRVEPFHIV
jgi:CRISPR-associated protein Cas2